MGGDNGFWEKLSFVLGAKNRKKVLLALDSPKTPTQIASDTGLSLNITSRALRELEKEGIIECKTPEAKVGRIYQKTRIGKKIIKKRI